jgi:hypothetical protein
LDKALVSGSNVDVYVLDTGIVIDLEDFGVPSSFASDFTGEQNHGDYVNATTLSTPEASPVFKEPLVIQGTPEAQFGRSIALSGDGSILAVGAPSFDNEFGSEEGRVKSVSAGGQFGEFHIRLLWSSRLRVGQVLSMSRSSPPVLAIGGANVDVYPISQFLDGCC